MKKIRMKYLLRMFLFIIFTLGSMTLIYSLVAEDLNVYESKKQMNTFYQHLQNTDIADLSNADDFEVQKFVESGFNVVIVEGENVVLASYGKWKDIEDTRRSIECNISKYSENAVAQMEEDSNSIKLRGKVTQNGHLYYVYLVIRLKAIKNSITYMNKFLMIELLIVLCVSIPFSFYMANKTVKPIEKISKMTRSMANNEYVNDEEYKFPDDEIGLLADSVRKMYHEINNNISELKNYNYLLQVQNRDLIAFDERRKQFISMATHELKTPLAIVSSQLEMLNLDNSEIMSEYYDSMMEEIQKMSNLIRDMLQSSFNERLLKKVELEEGNLSELILSLKEKHTMWLNSKHIMSRFDIEKDIYIKMNREQVEQAFNNYIINAYEHTKEHGKVIVSLYKKEKNAVLSVYNDGDNIRPDVLDKIWNSFYREKKEKANSNVGLGLYIVNDIVKYHDGKCYAINQPAGVEFVMTFHLLEGK